MSQFISLAEARSMTARYKTDKEQILKTEYQQKDLLLLSETFDRSSIDTLLAQPGCVGLRFYFGMMESLQVRLIVVAIDSEGKDIVKLPQLGGSENDVHDDIVEKGEHCPPNCPINPAM